jgi:hypothetical protein
MHDASRVAVLLRGRRYRVKCLLEMPAIRGSTRQSLTNLKDDAEFGE